MAPRKATLQLTLDPTKADNGRLATSRFTPMDCQFYLLAEKEKIITFHLLLHSLALTSSKKKMLVGVLLKYRTTSASLWRTRKFNLVVTRYAPVLIEHNFASDAPLTTTWELTFDPERDWEAQQTLHHTEQLLSQFAALYLHSSTADITLITDGRHFPAHRCILSARSAVFAAMFTHKELIENQENKVEIEDISGEVMEALLKYIYSGDFQGIEGIAGELLLAADKYDLPLLVEECAQSIVSNLSVSNVAYFFKLTNLHQFPELKAEIGQFIVRNFTQVQLSPDWAQYISPDTDLMEQFNNLQIA